MYMIKMLVFDLDGTLLTIDKDVSTRDANAIKHVLESSDVDLTIATGRMDHEINIILDSIEQSGKGNRISQNGAFVYSKEGEPLYSNLFDTPVTQDIFKEALGDRWITTALTEKEQFVIEKTEDIRQLESMLLHPLHETPDLVDQLGSSIQPSKISIFGETEDLKALQKTIDARFTDDLDSFISDPACLDIMPKHINKGAAVKRLIEEKGIKPEEIACVGDSYNDISMFELTPHSFAMPQAEPDVKAKANHVVNSVQEAIEHLLAENLIKQTV